MTKLVTDMTPEEHAYVRARNTAYRRALGDKPAKVLMSKEEIDSLGPVPRETQRNS